MAESRCPAELELWPRVVGEQCAPDVLNHLRRCEDCRRRVAAARKHLEMMRAATGQGVDKHAPARSRTSREENDFAADPPQSLGNFQILGVLGEGGQAIVYRAWHPRLNCEVAIKRLRANPGATTGNLAEETRFLSALSNAALPQPLDLEIVDGETLLILELIHGESLSRLTEPLSPTTLLRVTRQLASAVSELHRNDLLHLDLSPGNVLVDDAGNCRLIDFGLARRMSLTNLHSPEDVVGGTPGFAAPELWQSPQRVDQRADVYGIGAVMHYLMCGTPPAVSNDPAVVQFHQRWSVPGDDLSVRLWAICQRAIAQNPEHRWQAADEMIAALTRIEAGRTRSRRWLTLLTVAASLFVGADCQFQEAAIAEVLVHRNEESWKLSESPPVHLGDEVAFAFDARSQAAGLAIRTPSGKTMALKPFDRGVGEDADQFRFPPTGGAVLRREIGTYVAYFWPADSNQSTVCERSLKHLAGLPAPPELATGERLTATGFQAGLGDMRAAVREPLAGEWRRALAVCRLTLPGLTAIAFRVD